MEIISALTAVIMLILSLFTVGGAGVADQAPVAEPQSVVASESGKDPPTAKGRAINALDARTTIILPPADTIDPDPAPVEEVAPRETSAPVHQGARYSTDRGNFCTIGFVDKINRVAYTAAHCAIDNNTGTLNDFHGNVDVALHTDREVMGTMVHPDQYLTTPLPDYGSIAYKASSPIDIAAIELKDTAPVGENSHSGDTMIPYEDIQVGDQACFSRAVVQVLCGYVSGKHDAYNHIYVTTSNGETSSPGDSGGPVWIPGKGAIGILIGAMQTSAGDAGIAATGF